MNGGCAIVAPLNWGLGHAARCIPLIRALEEAGSPVVLASDGSALDLLRAAFPHLPSYELPSYGIRYRSTSMVRNILACTPNFPRVIRAERRAIRKLATRYGASCIFSDNRPGCHHHHLRSIYITHQLNVPTPRPWLSPIATALHRLLMKPFHDIWVPDHASEPSLAGGLSHPQHFDSRIRYIGTLSRFIPPGPADQYSLAWDCAVLISGPEPERARWEKQVLSQLARVKGKHIVVRGKPGQGDTQLRECAPHISLANHLPDAALREVLLTSRTIVSRSGYSSLMDYEQLGISAVLVPTPGQPEQQYLAELMAQRGRHRVLSPDTMDLHALLQGF